MLVIIYFNIQTMLSYLCPNDIVYLLNLKNTLTEQSFPIRISNYHSQPVSRFRIVTDKVESRKVVQSLIFFMSKLPVAQLVSGGDTTVNHCGHIPGH